MAFDLGDGSAADLDADDATRSSGGLFGDEAEGAAAEQLLASSAAAKKPAECVCPNCQRNMAASRFAPHLEKCMGMGRNSSRLASRRIARDANREAAIISDGEDGEADDGEWSASGVAPSSASSNGGGAASANGGGGGGFGATAADRRRRHNKKDKNSPRRKKWKNGDSAASVGAGIGQFGAGTAPGTLLVVNYC